MNKDFFGNKVEGIGEQVRWGLPTMVTELALSIDPNISISGLAEALEGICLVVVAQGATHSLMLNSLSIRGLLPPQPLPTNASEGFVAPSSSSIGELPPPVHDSEEQT